MLFTLNVKAITIKLEKRDSISSFVNSTRKYYYGNTGIFQIKDKFFKLGIFQTELFDLPHFENDSITLNSILTIYNVKNESSSSSFFENYEHSNLVWIKDMRYMYLEGVLFNVKYIDSTHIDITKNAAEDVTRLQTKQVLDCLYNINYFDEKFFDISQHNIPYIEMYEKGKLNIVYYTSRHCSPCEKIKNEMIELSHNKNLNIVFITDFETPFNSDYIGVEKKFYFKSTKDKIKYAGYPHMYLFDGNGELMSPELKDRKNLSLTELIKKYANSY